jgi:hypothetical protein
MFCRLEGFYKERRSAAASKIWTFLPPGTIYSALGPEALAPIFVNTGLMLPRRPPSSLLKIAMQPAKKKTAPCNKHLLAVVREEKKNSHAASEEKNSHAASEEKNSTMRQALAGSRARRKKNSHAASEEKNSHAASEEKNSHEASEEKNSVMQQALAGSRKKRVSGVELETCMLNTGKANQSDTKT